MAPVRKLAKATTVSPPTARYQWILGHPGAQWNCARKRYIACCSLIPGCRCLCNWAGGRRWRERAPFPHSLGCLQISCGVRDAAAMGGTCVECKVMGTSFFFKWLPQWATPSGQLGPLQQHSPAAQPSTRMLLGEPCLVAACSNPPALQLWLP